MRVLVVGATGVVGRGVVALLGEAGHDVRALIRPTSDPQAVAAVTATGATTVTGDLADAASIAAALDGVDAVVSTATAIGSQTPSDSLSGVDLDGQLRLVDLARQASVKRFVYVSVLGLQPNSPFTSAKLAVEERLRGSGLEYTIVAPSIFMDTWLSHHVGFDWEGNVATIYGDGTQKLGWVSAQDVATVVAATVDHAGSANATVPVVGPDSMTPLQVVSVFEELTGKPFTVEHVPAEALEAQRAGSEDPTEQSFAALMLRYAAGDPPATPMAGLPSPATSVRDYAQQLLGTS